MPNLEFINRKEEIDGKVVGQYALNHDNATIVFVKWGILFRKYDTYAFDGPLLDRIESENIYVVDKDTKDVYLFKKSAYQDGPMVKEGGKFQYILPRDEAIGKWDSLDEILNSG